MYMKRPPWLDADVAKPTSKETLFVDVLSLWNMGVKRKLKSLYDSKAADILKENSPQFFTIDDGD